MPKKVGVLLKVVRMRAAESGKTVRLVLYQDCCKGLSKRGRPRPQPIPDARLARTGAA